MYSYCALIDIHLKLHILALDILSTEIDQNVDNIHLQVSLDSNTTFPLLTHIPKAKVFLTIFDVFDEFVYHFSC